MSPGTTDICGGVYNDKPRGIITTSDFTPRICQKEEEHEGDHGEEV